jgi:hypothetical protein
MLSRIIKLAIIVQVAVLTAASCSPGNHSTTPVTTVAYKVPISVEYPRETPPRLILQSGLPGMIRLIGDNGSDFISGTIEVGDLDWAPASENKGNIVSLIQAAGTVNQNLTNISNLWKLRVSDKTAFALEIHNLHAEGHWNLSGLPITELYAESGTAKNAFTFDQPNPAVMQRAEFTGNSSPVVIEGILNAACREMVVRGGAGELTLRFGGTLVEKGQVSVQTGAGPVKITVSPDTPVRIIIAGTHPVSAGEGLIRQDSENQKLVFETAVYQENLDKTLEIEITGTTTKVYLNPLSSYLTEPGQLYHYIPYHILNNTIISFLRRTSISA